MERQQISSSDIRLVGYDNQSQILEIEFYSGGIYQYFDVPASVYLALMNATSKGTYFHKHIKEIYKYKRIK